MRRWFTLLLLVMLPLQFTWSVAAAYCQHEKAPEVRHIGHHEHEHSDAPNDGKAQADAGKLLTADNDCGYCHLSAARPLQLLPLELPALTGPLMLDAPVHPLRTRDPDRLERPNWSLA